MIKQTIWHMLIVFHRTGVATDVLSAFFNKLHDCITLHEHHHVCVLKTLCLTVKRQLR
jgi:hypothetical protein